MCSSGLKSVAKPTSEMLRFGKTYAVGNVWSSFERAFPPFRESKLQFYGSGHIRGSRGQGEEDGDKEEDGETEGKWRRKRSITEKMKDEKKRAVRRDSPSLLG
jgi:hypothetical protein